MCAHKVEQRSPIFGIEDMFVWLGGGHGRRLTERYERSTYAVAGAVAMFGSMLAWLVACLAASESAGLPTWAVVALTLVFGLLVGAVTRGIASGPARGWPAIAGRAVIAIAIGVVVGELAALVMFSGSISPRLHERALRSADSAPAVAQAVASLAQAHDARAVLDNAVEQAREHLDSALVVARCEYNPTPACPQTRITGVPGSGPEARTANELLADAQHELVTALAKRDRRLPELDAKVARDEQNLVEARRIVVADSSRGLGARWVVMNDLMLSSTGALVLRALTVVFFALLYLLPLILGLWRGETTHDHHTAAHAERERAELDADTAIAIKRAEVRRAAEIMWAEHQLTQARLAIEAQTEIDREHQRRRVTDALRGPARVSSTRSCEPTEDDVYLPIAAEAEAASRAILQSSARVQDPESAAGQKQNLPAQIELGGPIEPIAERATPLIPSIPGATKTAARWIRPLVPPIVARVIDNTTDPLRSARQVFEEVEEIAFSFTRMRKVTVDSESSDPAELPDVSQAANTCAGSQGIESSREEFPAHSSGSYRRVDHDDEEFPLDRAAPNDRTDTSVESTERGCRRELAERQRPYELRAPDNPRQLPPPQ